MKKPNELNNWIKKQIEDNPQLPPEAAWDQISENLDLENAWQGINQDLELDNLWANIDSRLQVCAQMLWWERAGTFTASVLAAMVVVLPLLWQLPGDEQTMAENSSTASTIVLQTEEVASSSEKVEEAQTEETTKLLPFSSGMQVTEQHTAEINTSAEQTAGHADKSSSAPALSNTAANATASASIPEATAFVISDNTAMPSGLEKKADRIIHTNAAGLNQEYGLLHYPATGFAAILQLKEAALPQLSLISDEETVVNSTKKSFHTGSWRVGVGASARASWLLNQKTYQALDKASLTTSLPAYKKSFSLLAEKSLTPKLALLTDVALHSEAGQRYLEYQSGTYGTTHTKLRYSHLNLLMAYRMGRAMNVNKTYMRLVAGIAGGWLHEAKLVTPSDTTVLTEDYKPLTAALVLGYEYNQKLLPRVWMSYGLRGHLDVFNSYAGSSQIPAEFRHTRNSFLDFTIGFKYDLMKK